MADPRREPRGSVTDALTAAPQRFDFHQAVRLLERAAGRRVGTDTLPAAEPVQIAVPPGLTRSIKRESLEILAGRILLETISPTASTTSQQSNLDLFLTRPSRSIFRYTTRVPSNYLQPNPPLFGIPTAHQQSSQWSTPEVDGPPWPDPFIILIPV